MPSTHLSLAKRTLVNFNRTPVDQVLENLRQALRVLDLVPSSKTDLTPHPLVIVRAEIENARRYLSLVTFTPVEDATANEMGSMLEVA
jgi:hypothetical protein